jgi:hypothetical protein
MSPLETWVKDGFRYALVATRLVDMIALAAADDDVSDAVFCFLRLEDRVEVEEEDSGFQS